MRAEQSHLRVLVTIVVTILYVKFASADDLQAELQLARDRLARAETVTMPVDAAQIYSEQQALAVQRDGLKAQMARIQKAKGMQEAYLKDVREIVPKIGALDCKNESKRAELAGGDVFSQAAIGDYQMWTTAAVESITELNNFLDRPDEISCNALVRWAQTSAAGYLERQSMTLDVWSKTATALLDVDTKLIEQYAAQEKRLATALEEARKKSNPPNEIASDLFKYLIVLITFCVLMLLALRTYGRDEQLEWIKSGQIIQAMTVIVLLFSILALGLSGRLKEEILGTLLGGVGGYVLSQGIRGGLVREASREVRSDGDSVKKDEGGSV